MKREIEFRGRTCNRWIFGNCIEQDKKNNTYRIAKKNAGLYPIQWTEVDTETIGQYTGMKDKNGKKIYEGDIVKDDYNVIIEQEHIDGCAYPTIGSGRGELFIGVVHYKPSAGFCMYPYFKTDYNTGKETFHKDKVKHIYQERCEVIGNIFDNPELIPKE